MNTDLNEKLRQYQRNYYVLKKQINEILLFVQYKDEWKETKFW